MTINAIVLRWIVGRRSQEMDHVRADQDKLSLCLFWKAKNRISS